MKPQKINHRSLNDRLNTIKKKDGRKAVVYIFERTDNTFRYRVYNVCQSLEKSKLWKASYFDIIELESMQSIISDIDVVIFSRVNWKFECRDLVQKLKDHDKIVGFDIDDLVFDIQKVPLVMNSISVIETPDHLSYWFSKAARLALMGNACDFTMGTNAYICDHLKRVFKKPTFEIANFLNQEQIDVSHQIYKKKIYEINKQNFRIGYFSGSPTHRNDLKRAASELVAFLEKYKDATLEIFGYMTLPQELQHLKLKKQVIIKEYVDFLTLQKKIAEVDVNIAPLVDNEFTNCKSELKFFEAAIVGTITCATPTFAFKNHICSEKTGFLCKEGDWYNALEKIYHKKYSEDLIENARNYCLNVYSPESQMHLIEKTFASILKVKR